MKAKINTNAFQGLTQFNGAEVELDVNKGTGQPIIGASGETMRFNIKHKEGSSLYLSPDQYEELRA